MGNPPCSGSKDYLVMDLLAIVEQCGEFPIWLTPPISALL